MSHISIYLNMRRYILLSIIILAAFLRFFRLSDYPAFNADEAAIGYNAYSLIRTGNDEHGNPWPIHFQSFNDYKPGLYFYLVIPFVKFLGLNEWAVRLPGATLGVLTVLAVYLLVNELFKEKKIIISHQSLAIISGFMLAISPWHIHFSRGGWEVNAATFFITAGVWLFLKGQKNKIFLLFSALVFVLSLYTYHAARIVVPLLVLGLLLIYRKDLRRNIKGYLVSGLIGLIILAPLFKNLAGPAGVSRAAGVGLFADTGPLARINEQRGEHTDFTSFTAKALHNKLTNYSLAFLENWSDHFWGEFLFLSGDEIQRNKVPETGVLYLFDLIFILVGLYAIAKQPRGWGLILLWLVVAPFAAALTFQSPHALRAHNMVIPLIVIGAFGFGCLIAWLEEKNLKFGIWILVFAIALSFMRYVHMYWVHMAKEYPFSSQYGVKELVAFIKEKEGDYRKVIVTDRYDQPYILFLFYLRYSPEQFQKEHVLTLRDQFGFSTVSNFDKYEFRDIDFDRVKPENPNSLIVGTNEDIPDEANIIKKIYFPNGEVAFKVVAN